MRIVLLLPWLLDAILCSTGTVLFFCGGKQGTPRGRRTATQWRLFSPSQINVKKPNHENEFLRGVRAHAEGNSL